MTVSIQEKNVERAQGLAPATRTLFWLLALQFTLYVLIAIFLLEAYLRIAAVGQQEFLQPDLQLGCKHIPNKVVTWRLEGFSNDRINSDGLRDSEHLFAKPKGVFRIALLGDSATESMQVNLDQTYGKVLESMLNEKLGGKQCIIDGKLIEKFEVINFGCSSYSTGQQLLQFRNQVCKYAPDSVVLLFNRGDTVENCLNLSAKDAPEPRPYFYLDQNGLIQADNTVLEANHDKLLPNPVVDFMRAHSRLYGVFSQANLSLSLTDSRYRKFRAWFDRLNAQVSGKPLRRTTSLTYAQPDGLAVTTGLVKTLAQEVRKNGQSFVLLFFPDMGHDALFAQQIDLLRYTGDSERFYCFDLAPQFRQCKNPADNFLWYHFSPKGHMLVAQRLATIFETQMHSKCPNALKTSLKANCTIALRSH